MAAAGVIVSLIYLSIQIRQSTRTEQARAFQEIFPTFTAHTNEMFSPENIELIEAGMVDFSSLAGRDRLRFEHLMLGYFNALESTIISKRAFLIDDHLLENWAFSVKTRLLPCAGVRDWWSGAKPLFAPETQTWVDRMISETDHSSGFFSLNSDGASG